MLRKGQEDKLHKWLATRFNPLKPEVDMQYLNIQFVLQTTNITRFNRRDQLVIALFYENHKKPMIKFCGQNAGLVIDTAGGKYSYHWTLKQGFSSCGPRATRSPLMCSVRLAYICCNIVPLINLMSENTLCLYQNLAVPVAVNSCSAYCKTSDDLGLMLLMTICSDAYKSEQKLNLILKHYSNESCVSFTNDWFC
jgi:hypothetical protein